MKKLFFFRSSSSNAGNNNTSSPPSADKQVYWEAPFQGKQACDNQSTSNSLGLRRSRSLSSTTYLDDGKGNFSCIDQAKTPSSSSGSHQQYDHSSRNNLFPERRAKTKQFEVAATGLERSGYSNSHHDSSGNSTSSNVSSKVVDRYIDGEQQQEMSQPKNSSQRSFIGSRNADGRLPPRVQYTAPTSPMDNIKDKPRSHSFREYGGTRQKFSSRDWVDKGYGHESPRKLAKNVLERLSLGRSYPKSRTKELACDIPITIEDVYGGSKNSCMDVPAQKSCSPEEPCETNKGYNGDDFSVYQKSNHFLGDELGDMNSVSSEDMVDVKLQHRSKEAEERVVLLSEELEQEGLLPR
ncbi:CAP-GLY DOMAIN LINKER [Salix koriyanagi]|uniref:CAP-GLY DOMAIN LINKER n=1 Tax=Salix koriyanagi TaxID=2511006 RepID=A0A9Q0WK86_9ROSI|nr:CAP-GLY DOMAIN LINKER [Salix koriyanagi]